MNLTYPAKYKYQNVRYSPFEAAPGDASALIADPWAYLSAHLLEVSSKSRGVKKSRLLRALHYLELAEGFYSTMNRADFPTKGVLAYYGVLNLVKCFLSASGIVLEKRIEHHGLSLPLNKKHTVEIKYSASVNEVSIFQEFCKSLGRPVKSKHTISIKQFARHMPDIHEIAYGLNYLDKRSLLPIGIRILVDKSKTKLMSEVYYEKKSEARIQTSQINKFYKGKRKKYFKRIGENEGRIVFQSAKKKPVNKSNWPKIYKNLCREFSDFEIVSLLTRDGYKYYCDLAPGSLHHLAYTYIYLYYIGSIARYRPSEAKEIMQSKLKPITYEVMESSPYQFLYHITSLLTKKVCVIPHSKIK